jgi:predicted DNA-binding transcriptional regulator AlpA
MSALTQSAQSNLTATGRITDRQQKPGKQPTSRRRTVKTIELRTQQYDQAAQEACYADAASESQIDRLRRQAAVRENKINATIRTISLESVCATCAQNTAADPCHTRGRGEGTRSNAKSGDGNSNNADSEPPRPGLVDAAALANLLCVSKKTIQNIYSRTPHLLPQAIQIPGARGPRWTPESVQEWLNNRPRHTPKPLPVAPKKKVGRPRLALRSAGGASC